MGKVCGMQSRGARVTTIVPFICEICGAAFPETRGGRCVKCGKIVCRAHVVPTDDGPKCMMCLGLLRKEERRSNEQ
jgi:hypothetical protein